MSPEEEQARQIVAKMDGALSLIREAHALATAIGYGGRMLASIDEADAAVRHVLEDLS